MVKNYILVFIMLVIYVTVFVKIMNIIGSRFFGFLRALYKGIKEDLKALHS